jgi:hypothetical protein
MSAEQTSSVINSWDTIRLELLNTPVRDLRLGVEGSPLDPMVRRLYRELKDKAISYRPKIYLSDSWGCPNEVPLIGIPFYLADRRLSRIEEEQTGEIEDEQMIMMLLRHEAGHAVNYAYRLWETPGWTETFGRFSRPYRDSFEPDPLSRQFVRHLMHSQYRWTYAQKHPDEDFAETFAVWVTPRSGWRRKYMNWPAINKLLYVDRLMRKIRKRQPTKTSGEPLNPVDELSLTLAEHYGQRTEKYRALAQGYVDDNLREVFPHSGKKSAVPAERLIRHHRRELLARITRWSSLDQTDARTIIDKLVDRSKALRLDFEPQQEGARVLDLTALATALAMDFGYTGRFTA